MVNIKICQSPAVNIMWISRNFKVLWRTLCEYQEISKSCCERSVNIQNLWSPAANHRWISKKFKVMLWILGKLWVFLRICGELFTARRGLREYSHHVRDNFLRANLFTRYSEHIHNIFATSSLVGKGNSLVPSVKLHEKRKPPIFYVFDVPQSGIEPRPPAPRADSNHCATQGRSY